MEQFSEYEQLRLAALRRYLSIDDLPGSSLNRVTRLAAEVCHVPAAAISFVGEKRVWFKSLYGLEIKETDRDGTFSDLVIGSPFVTIIPDVLNDRRLSSAPILAGDCPVRFCAGTPLTGPQGYRIGALSILDTRSRRRLPGRQAEMLQDLASMAMDALEHRLEPARASDMQDQFQRFIESTPLVIIGVNREGRIKLANGLAARVFGYEPDELIGQRIEILIPDRVRHIHSEEREQYLSRPRFRPMGIGVELRARHRSGREFPVEIGLAPIEWNGDLMTISFITDISERSRMEEQVRQSQKLEAVGQLSAGVAHDFNNLLTVILGNGSIALEGAANCASVREPLQTICEAAERGAEITHKLLAFARKQITKPTWLDFNVHISRTCGLLRRLVGSDIEVKLILGEHVGETLADPILIDQVLINLAVNARDAMPGGGHLRITTGAVELGEESAGFHLPTGPGPYIKLTVSDTGIGMTPEILARIFEPFFTTKGPGEGTGLGLASVYGSVKQVGGGISVSSKPDRGSTFDVFFPRIHETHVIEDSPEQEKVSGGSETILLAEDEAPVRRFVSQVLDRLGYRVVEAGNGKEALRIIEEGEAEIDLILTDVVMPEMNGLALISAVTEKGIRMKVIMMSGNSDRIALTHDINFIQKPFSAGQLGKKVRDVLNGRSIDRSIEAQSAGQAPG